VFANTFKKVSEMEKYKDIEFKSIDIEEDEGELYVEKYNIRSVPTILLLDEDDNIIYKLSGNIPLDDFVSMINNAMEQK
jgi:thioredoxin-related protein